MDSWIQDHPTQSQIWTEMCWAFWSHFEDPNATAIWLAQIWKLKIGENRAQRYVDHFKLLAMKLKWNLQEETTIYQFKTGLLWWILTQLLTAESNFILTTETNPGIEIKPIDVDILMKLVIIIGSIHRLTQGNRSCDWRKKEDLSDRKKKKNLSDKRKTYQRAPFSLSSSFSFSYFEWNPITFSCLYLHTLSFCIYPSSLSNTMNTQALLFLLSFVIQFLWKNSIHSSHFKNPSPSNFKLKCRN